MNEGETFDYVIVGAGSAGCVLARRLSEDAKTTVCLIEAGPTDRSPFIHIPAGIMRLFYHPVHNYKFMSTPQPHCKDRPIYVPRGRGLGGSSSINGMVFIRGHRRDYDEWAELGNPGWSWNDMLPYFRKSTRNENLPNDAFYDENGPLSVKYLDSPNPLDHVFVEAAASLQRRCIPDFNTGDNEGFGIHQTTTSNGRRQSAAVAYLHPVKHRPNLKILTDHQVVRIALADGRASGVEVRANGQARLMKARREVILSAGAIHSPQLLMLSGIGDGHELRKFGIEVRHHAPGVGANLQDHAACSVQYASPRSASYGLSFAAMPKIAWNLLLYAVARKGFLANNIIEASGFIRTRPDLDRPDIQLMFVPSYQTRPGQMLAWGHGYRIASCLLQPKSRGRIGVASAKVDDPPVIDFNFYSDPDGEDLATMIRGIKDAQRILEAPAFKDYRGRCLWPSPSVKTDEQYADFVREYTSTVFHPTGTCRMGKDDQAVVDARLRVRGLKGLRVVDASIMPTIVSGNTNAPTIAIAEKGADLIKADARAA